MNEASLDALQHYFQQLQRRYRHKDAEIAQLGSDLERQIADRTRIGDDMAAVGATLGYVANSRKELATGTWRHDESKPRAVWLSE